jgi:hypothetical protein
VLQVVACAAVLAYGPGVTVLTARLFYGRLLLFLGPFLPWDELTDLLPTTPYTLLTAPEMMPEARACYA